MTVFMMYSLVKRRSHRFVVVMVHEKSLCCHTLMNKRLRHAELVLGMLATQEDIQVLFGFVCGHMQHIY